MNDDNIFELVSRQLSGTISESELSLLRKWYEESEDNKKAYSDYCTILKGVAIERDRQLFTANMPAAWDSIKSRINAPRKRRYTTGKLLRYAAMVAIAVVIVWAANGMLPATTQTDSITAIEVPAGSKSCVTLPDGSQVWLNSGSTLTYGSDFGHGSRSVKLDGEGFFSVTKNKSVPFIVSSGNTSIRVIGTKFDMKAYAGDPCRRITLMEGSVQVTVGGLQQILKPNQQAVITGKNMQIREVVAENYREWTATAHEKATDTGNGGDSRLPTMVVPDAALRKSLIFDHEPLSQIVRDLGRTFNVEIHTDDNISDEVFYGDFRNDESLYHILDIISSTSNVEYTIDSGKVNIRKKQ